MSRPTQVPASQLRLRIRGSHPLRRGVPSASASPSLRFCRSYNPGTGLKTAPVWALPVPLAATPGIVITFSSCAYLDVSVQRVRLRLRRMTGSLPPGSPIRKSADHRAFAPPRGFSQLVTSFLASESPGIPHAPLFVPLFLYNVRLHLASPAGEEGDDCSRLAFDFVLPAAFRPPALVVSTLCLLATPRLVSTPCGATQRASRLQHVNVLVPSVENNGFDPLTPCLQSRCSSQLS